MWDASGKNETHLYHTHQLRDNTVIFFNASVLRVKEPQCTEIHVSHCDLCVNELKLALCLTGIMSATGNGYVIFMTIKRKTKLKPPELMTVNLAIFDFGISGTTLCVELLHSTSAVH